MITEVEVIKHLVQNHDSYKFGGDASDKYQSKLEKECRNQLFQTIYVQWHTFLNEVKKQILAQNMEEEFIFDTKILGKIKVKNNKISFLSDQKVECIDFDFGKVSNKVGIVEE